MHHLGETMIFWIIHKYRRRRLRSEWQRHETKKSQSVLVFKVIGKHLWLGSLQNLEKYRLMDFPGKHPQKSTVELS